jgi:hypothetical protein
MKPYGEAMKSKKILLLDAIINLILGVLLLAYSENLSTYLGVPYTSNYFYPNILGAIFIGITIALFIEFFKTTNRAIGLGLHGAIAINLCGGIVLALWLIFGNLNLPIKGQIFLWVLVFLLVGISSIEVYFNKT